MTGYGFLPFRDWPVGAASPSEIGEEENCEEWPAHSPLANERREGMEAKRLRSSNSVGEATVVGSRPGDGHLLEGSREGLAACVLRRSEFGSTAMAWQVAI